jgi:hypothetical protein
MSKRIKPHKVRGRELEEVREADPDGRIVVHHRTVDTLGTNVSPAQVALCLIDLKLARLIRDPKHLDSQVDVAGYAACLREITK